MLSREQIADRLAEVGYIAEPDLATALLLMDMLSRPLLIEGEAGVGKTEVAKALAELHGTNLIRLQCYEGLDQSAALYEWNYQRQLLAIKAREGGDADAIETAIFSERYLLARPLLAAIRQEVSPVLLIDEIDRADEEFEAFLLELLSDFQVSIPELGTIAARSIPRVVLTSNGTRELSDALRRRCLYHHLDYPTPDREVRIILARVPGITASLARQVAGMIAALRREELAKVPGVAETLDWAGARCSGLAWRGAWRRSCRGVRHPHLRAEDQRGSCADQQRGDRPADRAGGVMDGGGRIVERLAGFTATLRDNGFSVGLAGDGRCGAHSGIAACRAAGAARPGVARLAVFAHRRVAKIRRDFFRLLARARRQAGDETVRRRVAAGTAHAAPACGSRRAEGRTRGRRRAATRRRQRYRQSRRSSRPA